MTLPADQSRHQLPGWKLYALTTADRPQREAHIRNEIDRLGIAHTVQVGTRPIDKGGFASVGFRGCFENHLACLRAAQADGVDVAVLVEDDAVVIRRFWHFVGPIAAEAATLDWTMLYLGYLASESLCQHERVTMLTPHIATADGWEVMGAHFVAIKATAIADVIADFERRLLPGGSRISVDGILNEIRRNSGSPTLLCFPNLSRQGPSPSGITQGGRFESLLKRPRVQQVAELFDRVRWDLESFVPVRLHERFWNRRARRHPRPD